MKGFEDLRISVIYKGGGGKRFCSVSSIYDSRIRFQDCKVLAFQLPGMASWQSFSQAARTTFREWLD